MKVIQTVLMKVIQMVLIKMFLMKIIPVIATSWSSSEELQLFSD